MASPSWYSLHPIAAFWDDCGLGSDPNASGPCSGTYGPGPLSNSLNEQLAGGRAEVLAVGAALLVLAALLLLLRMIRKPVGVRAVESADLDGYVCRKCGSDDVSGSSIDQVVCGACGFVGNADFVGDGEMSDDAFVAKIESLRPGQSWCQGCDLVYPSDGYGCPCCGGGSRLWEDDDDDSLGDVAPVCDTCGEPFTPDEGSWVGGTCSACNAAAEARADDDDSMAGADDDEPSSSETSICSTCGQSFTPDESSWIGDTCSACNAAYDEAHALDDVDAGPDDDEAVHGNPDGIGSRDGGLRA